MMDQREVEIGRYNGEFSADAMQGVVQGFQRYRDGQDCEEGRDAQTRLDGFDDLWMWEFAICQRHSQSGILGISAPSKTAL